MNARLTSTVEMGCIARTLLMRATHSAATTVTDSSSSRPILQRRRRVNWKYTLFQNFGTNLNKLYPKDQHGLTDLHHILRLCTTEMCKHVCIISSYLIAPKCPNAISGDLNWRNKIYQAANRAHARRIFLAQRQLLNIAQLHVARRAHAFLQKRHF